MTIADTRRANLARLLDERFQGNKAALARALARPAPQIHRLLSDSSAGESRAIGEKLARRIESALQLPSGWLDAPESSLSSVETAKSTGSDAILDGYVTVPGFLPARADEFTLVPRLDARGSCGGGADNGDEPLELEPLAFRNEWLRGKGARDPVVIDARGDSMSPFIVHGDVILFDRAKTAVVSGQIYLVQTPDGLRVKRVHREFDGSITLRSDNADKVRFPDERVPPDLVPQLVVVGSFVWRGGG